MSTIPPPRFPSIAPVMGYRVCERYAYFPAELFLAKPCETHGVLMMKSKWVWLRKYYVLQRLVGTGLRNEDVIYGWRNFGSDYLTNEEAAEELRKYQYEEK